MYTKKPKGWIKHIDFIILDIISLQLAFVLAYAVRHDFSTPYLDMLYHNIAVVYVGIDFLVLIFNNTLKNVLKRGFYQELKMTLIQGLVVEVLIIVVLFAIQASSDFSRIVITLTGVFYVIIAYTTRLVWKQVVRRMLVHNVSTSIFVFATTAQIPILDHIFDQLDHSGYYVAGLCILDENHKGEEIAGIEVTENAGDVVEFLCHEWIDEIYFAESNTDNYKDLIGKLLEMGLVVHMEIFNLPEFSEQKQVVEKLAGHKVLTVSINMANMKQTFFKRFVDICAGLVGSMVTIILTIIIGPIIFINSPGPIFFSQTRIGQNGKRFKMFKFRSMYLDAEERKKELMEQNRVQDGMMFKLDYDPRIIGAKKLPDGTIKKGIGNFIRDFSLDEFPQFFNVLIGDMSLVGTRPPTEDEWEKYQLHHRARLAIKPGITGLWQVSGRSNITDFEQVVLLDHKYIQEWSLQMDMMIALKTVKVILGRTGAM